MANGNGSATTLAAPPVSWTMDTAVVFDASGLTGDQRTGRACITCRKKWPRPRLPVGRLPDGQEAMACEDCAADITRSLDDHAVQHVLTRAAETAARHAPNILGALIKAEPTGYTSRPRHAVETAAIAVARHLQATEDFVGVKALPARITEWEHAYAWLTAWRETGPPAAELQEVLRGALEGMRGGRRG